ncbi:MAG: two-component system, cell cycle sensor histidine kinase and response regulator CckA [Rhodobacteraceae bacterium HLUCCA12]|nr:MAG: two-component system, cell cycle sensor histidine kinase and response regulator CckA [Rhodobacteraceae bacterium HLUCCA12]
MRPLTLPASDTLARSRADRPAGRWAGSGAGTAPGGFGDSVRARLLQLRPILPGLVLAAFAGFAAVAMFWGQFYAPIVLSVATTLAVIVLTVWLASLAAGRARSALAETLMGAAAHDPDAILLSDWSGRILAANPAARRAGGADRATLPNPADLLARWSAEPDRVVAALAADAVAGSGGQRDFARADGDLRLSVHRADIAAGGAELLIWRFGRRQGGAARDADMLGIALLTLGPDDAIVTANAAFRARIGADAAHPDVPCTPVDPGVATALNATLAPLRQGVNPALVTLPAPGGGQRCLAYAVSAPDGQRDIVFLPDWMAPGRADGAPVDETAPPRHEFEDIPVALLMIDAEGRVIETNRLARALMGLAPDETRHFWEVVEGLGRPVADWLADARAGRALNRPEVLRAALPPQETFVQIILRRASGPGSDGALVAVLNDATELKSLEARFVQSQKMQAIGQLAGGVAHDFNNLLTAISGHCDLLLLERDHFDPDYGDLVQIHQNANRAAALVRQLLAFSRKQTLKPETLRLESLLEELAHLLTRLVGERITLTLAHDPAVRAIRADRRQLEQVLMNLVVNARDAMPMGGEIRIETQFVTLSTEQERGRARVPPGDYAVIRVIDEGVGIAADIIDKIFEPFFTTKRTGEGTGLGLSTAYGIVKQMGGWIFADSTEGSGTEFALYFAAHETQAHDPAPGHDAADPAARRRVEHAVSRPSAPVAGVSGGILAPDRAPRPGARPGPAGHGRLAVPGEPMALARGDGTNDVTPARPVAEMPDGAGDGAVVLLVEDEGPVRAFAARALRLQGYHVIEAENGEQALEFLQDSALRVDIFVTDIIMPGIDGPGWVSHALQDRPGTPVLFVSGYTEDGLSAALSRIPRSVFLGKPFSLSDLTETIAGQLAGDDRR